jgi:hypothetical protein
VARARDVLLEAVFEREAASRYVDWMLRYILFHNKRHRLEMGTVESKRYLSGPVLDGVACRLLARRTRLRDRTRTP